MATNPESPSSGRPHQGNSWAERVRLAREAEPPAIDVRHGVQAALAAEARVVATPAAEDGWSAFAALFAAPRVWIPSMTCTLLGAPCALWLLVVELGQLDACAKFLVIGGLPPWLAALVT